MNEQPLLHYDVAYPERLSRLLIFFKWLLVIPHLIVLYVLQIAMQLVSVIGFFAILFTGNYPRSLWDFVLMVLRWQARVYAYTYLQRDEYPPFGDSDYPVLFHLDYPASLSRWKIFVKWLLVIPHLIVLSLIGIAVSIALIVAWFAILFAGKMPRGIFDFITGYSRWYFRVLTYTALLTDAYPPFSMDHIESPTTPIGGGTGTQGQLPPQSW